MAVLTDRVPAAAARVDTARRRQARGAGAVLLALAAVVLVVEAWRWKAGATVNWPATLV